MQCPLCQVDRDKEDFLGKEQCFKCTYLLKVMAIEKRQHCKICGGRLAKNKWAYCSAKCAGIAKVKQRKSYWTNRL